MTKPNEKLVEFPGQTSRDVLTDVLRAGARQLLATVIEAEVDDYLAARGAAARVGVCELDQNFDPGYSGI